MTEFISCLEVIAFRNLLVFVRSDIKGSCDFGEGFTKKKWTYVTGILSFYQVHSER